jgi:uncharacterized protein (DUF433 family)
MVDTIALTKDEHGVYRIGDTRVTLDGVVHAFDRGATAEEIVQDWPSLDLSDVYQVSGYCLKRGEELAPYLKERSHAERDLLAANEPEWSPLGLRERLLARRKTS